MWYACAVTEDTRSAKAGTLKSENKTQPYAEYTSILICTWLGPSGAWQWLICVYKRILCDQVETKGKRLVQRSDSQALCQYKALWFSRELNEALLCFPVSIRVRSSDAPLSIDLLNKKTKQKKCLVSKLQAAESSVNRSLLESPSLLASSAQLQYADRLLWDFESMRLDGNNSSDLVSWTVSINFTLRPVLPWALCGGVLYSMLYIPGSTSHLMILFFYRIITLLRFFQIGLGLCWRRWMNWVIV